jgi:hypothetical protein
MLRYSARLSCDRRRVVAAHVVEPTQDTIRTAHNDQWLAREVKREKLPGGCDLIQTSNGDPVVTEDLVAFQIRDALIDIPGRGYGVRHFQRRILIVERKNIFER